MPVLIPTFAKTAASCPAPLGKDARSKPRDSPASNKFLIITSSNSAGDDFIKSSNSNFTPLSLSIVLHSDFNNASRASKVATS